MKYPYGLNGISAQRSMMQIRYWIALVFIFSVERQYAGTGGYCKEFVTMLRCLRRLTSHALLGVYNWCALMDGSLRKQELEPKIC